MNLGMCGDMIGDDYLLKQAIELANHIVKRFNKDTDLPYPKIYGANSQSNLAEIGSIQIEFSFLANITGTHEYFDKVFTFFFSNLIVYLAKLEIGNENLFSFTGETTKRQNLS